jgi:hypothetical protein
VIYGPLDEIAPERVTDTTAGWIDEATMLRYLYWISTAMQGDPLALVMDRHGMYTRTPVRDNADSLTAEAVCVPPGTSGQCQLLDLSTVSPITKIAANLWNPHVAENLRDNRTATVLPKRVSPRLTAQACFKGCQFRTGDPEDEHKSNPSETPSSSESDYCEMPEAP